MEFPQVLRAHIEQRFESENLKAMTAVAEGLSSRYRSESGTGKSLVSSSRDVLAYAAVRMPATYGAVSRALELTLRHFSGELTSILDVGAGTGAAALAAAEITGCQSVTCIERERAMISLGSELMRLRGISPHWINRDISAGISEKAALVLCSYCMNEMSAEARKTALCRLWDAAEQLLLIIEPGTPAGFAQLKEARNTLAELGGHIVAPCPEAEQCPLPDDDWCHFTVRIPRTRLHKQLKGGDAPYEDEKFCFLAVSKTPQNRCKARILRHPRIESGKITLRLCTENGIHDSVITRKSPLFKSARKADSGDSFNE